MMAVTVQLYVAASALATIAVLASGWARRAAP